MHDIIVVGGGPAGLVAALYALRAEKSVLVIEKTTFGGQITFSPKVENIPGFVSLSGNEFAEKLVEQVLEQGGEFEVGEVLKIADGEEKTVVCDSGEYKARAVVIATGAKHRMLGIEGEEKFVGEGISFCAVCDGAFYKDKIVGVVGGGNSALQEAILLSETSKKVYIIQNLDFLTGEKKLCDKVYATKNIEVILGSVVKGFIGDSELEGVKIENADGEKNLTVDGLFVAIGLIPQNEIFKDLITLDERGYAISGEEMTTKTEGIFVAGDCRTKKIRQIATAVSDGAIAGLRACDFVDEKR